MLFLTHCCCALNCFSSFSSDFIKILLIFSFYIHSNKDILKAFRLFEKKIFLVVFLYFIENTLYSLKNAADTIEICKYELKI